MIVYFELYGEFLINDGSENCEKYGLTTMLNKISEFPRAIYDAYFRTPRICFVQKFERYDSKSAAENLDTNGG